MRIAFIDLNHRTRGIHTNTVPLGLGLISRYLQATVDHPFDIRMFKDTVKALDCLGSWEPNVLGLSLYVWNSELNLHVARMVKENYPDCLVVAGGPNLDPSPSGKVSFLTRHPFVDLCVSYDGEIPFAGVVRSFLSSGMDRNAVKQNPPSGCYALHPESGALVEDDQPPPRLESLDVFGTVYADGVFDEFFEDGFHPFVQTHRGCPFTCAFCHTSDYYYSKMLFQSPGIFEKEMEYLGRRFSGQRNVTLYIANTNMSLFDQDFEIAKIIRRIQERYDWPALLNVNSGKNPQKLLEMLSIIDFQPILSLQTLTPGVLKNVGRRNIPMEEFIEFQRQVSGRTGGVSGTELILSLPGETRESFLKSLSTLLNSDIQNIVIYTLMRLKGTPLYSEKCKQEYGHVVRFRVVPRQFSNVNGTRVIESEEVIVGTDQMPYADYLELRGLSFVVKLFFGSTELVPLKRFLRESGADLGQWTLLLQKGLVKYPDIYGVYQEFMRETEEELFESRESLLAHFNQPEHWEALVTERAGSNLLRKYMRVLLYEHFESFLHLSLSKARELVEARITGEDLPVVDEIFKDLERYLSTRSIRRLVEGGPFFEKEFHLEYDVPTWSEHRKEGILLKDLKGPHRYRVRLENEARKWLEKFSSLNQSTSLSLENLYHEQGIENLWPSWIPGRTES